MKKCGKIKGHRLKMSLLFVLVFAMAPCLLYAQDTLWTHTYGGIDLDRTFSIQQTSDGGYILGGTSGSWAPPPYYPSDFFLVKTDASGDTIWTRTYDAGQEAFDYGECARQTSDGGYIIAGGGRPRDEAETDGWLVKTDANGNVLWSQFYFPTGDVWEQFYWVEQTTDSGYIAAGYAGDYTFVVKTDDIGDTVWTRVYPLGTYDWASHIEQTPDGGYIVAGGAADASWYCNTYLLKIDSDGNIVWCQVYDGGGDDWANHLAQTDDGGYILAGVSDYYEEVDAGVFVVKTNSLGDTIWTRIYGGVDYDEGGDVIQTSDGGYLIVGSTYSFGAGGSDFYVIRTDAFGDTLWTQTYGGLYDESWVLNVDIGSDGGYAVVGATYSFGAGDEDGWVVKLAPEIPPCVYTPGDINGDGNVMGNDVTYGVRYFKGLGSPPPDSCPYNDGWLYVAGDANGSCSFAGSDITFLVAYFKGYNPEILWCPQLPPPGQLSLSKHSTEVPLIVSEKVPQQNDQIKRHNRPISPRKGPAYHRNLDWLKQRQEQ